MQNDDPVLANHDGARYAGQHTKTWDNMRAAGKGPQFFRVGHKVFYRKSAIDQWLHQLQSNCGGDAA